LANPEINIKPDGTLLIDGKVVTPQEASTLVKDAHKLWLELQVRSNWSIKNAERLLAYGVGLVGATDGFSFLAMPADLRATLVGAAAFVAGMIHLSTPTKAG
jgi:hypothetical protein